MKQVLGDITVSRETESLLKDYQGLLEKWNPSINLIAKGEDIWNRHILDSLQLVSLIPDEAHRIVDLGSGGGLPGLVLAIATHHEIHLVESDQRKSIFLKEASRKLGLSNVTVHSERIESLDIGRFDVVFARALAPLNSLLSYAYTLLNESGICLFPKGKNWSIEKEDADKEWHFSCHTTPSISHPEGFILTIRDIRKLSP